MKHLLSLLAALIVALAPAAAHAAAEVLVIPAPYTVTRGDPILLGVLTGVAANDALVGAQVRLRREGVFVVPKVTGTAWSQGDALYFAAGDAGLSKVATKVFFGIATADATSGAATGSIVLVPSGPFAAFATTFTTGALVADNATIGTSFISSAGDFNGTVESVDVSAFWDLVVDFSTTFSTGAFTADNATIGTTVYDATGVVGYFDFAADVVADGVTDNTATLQAYLDAAPTGGALMLPCGPILSAATLTRTTPITVTGACPPSTLVRAPFGDGGWTLASIDGTAIITTSTSGALLTLGDTSGGHYAVRDVAFLGLGNDTRTTDGLILVGGGGAMLADVRGVMSANMRTGINCSTSCQDGAFIAPRLYGSQVGLNFASTANSNTVTAIDAGANDAGVVVYGTQNHFTGGTIQGSIDYGVRVLGGMATIDDIHFENGAGTTAAISLECSTGGRTGICSGYSAIHGGNYGATGDDIRIYTDNNRVDIVHFPQEMVLGNDTVGNRIESDTTCTDTGDGNVCINPITNAGIHYTFTNPRVGSPGIYLDGTSLITLGVTTIGGLGFALEVYDALGYGRIYDRVGNVDYLRFRPNAGHPDLTIPSDVETVTIAGNLTAGNITTAATATIGGVLYDATGPDSISVFDLWTQVQAFATAFTTGALTADNATIGTAFISAAGDFNGTVESVDVSDLNGTVSTDSARITTLETNAGFAHIWDETGANTDTAEHAFTAAISMPAMSVGEAFELHVWWIDGANPDTGVITYRTKIGSETITSTGGTLGSQTRQSHVTVFCTAANTYSYVQWNASTANANFNQNTFDEGNTGVGSAFTINFYFQFGTGGGNNRGRIYATALRKFRAGP